MKIEAPKSFWHAGFLSQTFASKDPRQATFAEGMLDVDMRNCEFVRPPAVLWCLIYPLLAAARATSCRLLVPENMGVCVSEIRWFVSCTAGGGCGGRRPRVEWICRLSSL